MVRTQIQLTSDLHTRLRQWAQRRGVSFSEAVRRCIAEKLSRDDALPHGAAMLEAALGVCGQYSDPSGQTDVAEEHDEHLAEAFGR